MPILTFGFYVGNVFLCTAYIVLAALSLKYGGVSGSLYQSRFQRLMTFIFFLCAAGLHADMALHVILRSPFFDDHGLIVSDLAIIVLAETVTVVVGLILNYRERRLALMRRRKDAPP